MPVCRKSCSSVVILAALIAGCGTSETPTALPPSANVAGSATGTQTEAELRAAKAAAEYDALSQKYPDVPRVEVLTELDGVPIPRNTSSGADFEIGAAIPADVGNTYVAQNPATPSTGGRLVIRFNAEPKTMNPVTETSSYQRYIQEYTHDTLARRNPETLEYEPKLASKWLTEDAVRLSADYPGHIRRIRQGDGTAAAELEITAAASADPDKPTVLTFYTLDEAGQPLGNVWVGFYPLDAANMPGAPANGYHQWSDVSGKLEVSGFVPGRYRVHVGDELYGLTERAEDGTLTVTPASAENPLSETLKASGDSALVLKPADYVDVQRETIYTYYLRPEATWTDGRPFTAQDLEFGYSVIRNPDVDCDSVRVYYADLIECTPLGQHVVRMKYREQYFLAFDFTYTLPGFTPPKHLFEQFFRDEGKELTLERLTPEQEAAQNKVSVHGAAFAKFFNSEPTFSEKPIGTGPYYIESWNRNEALTLRRRQDYWDTQHGGYLDTLVFKFIPDNTTALQALRSGEIDFHYMMTPEQYFDDWKQLPKSVQETHVRAQWFSPGFSYTGWNELQPKFQDPRVRMALALLFDKQSWIDKKLHGGAVAVSGASYIFGFGYDRSVLPVGYDPETARELLEKAGWVDSNGDGFLDKDGETFRCSILLSSGSKLIEEQMALLQKELKQVGIDVDIQLLEWASYLERIHNKDFDICRLSWSQDLESDPFQIWHGSQAGVGKRSSNHVSFNNPQANALIEMLRVTLDKDKRRLIHCSMHRLLDREQPYLFFYTSKDFAAYDRTFRGVKWYPLRPGYDLREWWIAPSER
jgi:peptide/nickel transport system substrate-binding protein